ncbi:MAG: Si-specific NAD(P)(+) transhydrogenase [Myxococcales bacterium]|nr:Si-specific NAD(P)(+) transhydrogenase [Myxococcales bacterium]
MDEFDLVVIGGGAAGEKGAVQAAYFGKSVALIEKETVHGGAMVNTGTLPSKTLRETALYLSGFRQRGLHGVDLALSRQASVDDFLYRLEAVVTEERLRISANLERHRVRTFHGAARFVDPHTIAIDGGATPRVITAKRVLIATGSSPHRPPQFPFDHTCVYDSDEIVRIHDIPKSMVVVGGGVIGCEYACLFATLGVKVTVVEPRPNILGFLDDDVVEALKTRMQALHVAFRMPAQVWGCETLEHGVRLSLDSGNTLDADCVLVCAGRQGNTGGLGLEHAGLEVNKRGQLTVDPVTFTTKVPHIAAVGDVIGFPALASTSMEQARVAVVHFFDLKYKTAVSPVFPYGIYTIPEVSMVGETERDLTAKGVDYVVGRSDFASNARGQMVGAEGFLKLLFRRDDLTLLGVHCIGESATELVHIGLVALMSHAKADLFINTCFNYPTLSEAYKYATYDALGRRAQKG